MPFDFGKSSADEMLLRVSDVAGILKCSEQWIRKETVAGRLKALMTPLGRLFDPEEVRRYLREHEASFRLRSARVESLRKEILAEVGQGHGGE